jgi:ABC-type antimicrobial peptide transport system permease subunit
MADARRRSFELAALRVVGVGQKALRRSAITEQALLLGAAVLLGLPSGYLAAYLVLPVIPEFSDTTPVTLRFGPSIELALLCTAAFAVLLTLTANVAGRMLVRAAVPVRLREAA